MTSGMLRAEALDAFDQGHLLDAWNRQREALRLAFDVEWLNDLGVIAHRIGREDQARALLTAVLAIDPGHTEAAENLATLDGGPAPEAQPKGAAELSYWQQRKAAEGELVNEGYRFFYTTHFGLPEGFHRGLRMLDVGCGPRGSLEWADGAARRVGLDPLAAAYAELGTAEHAMEYVAAGAESMPFADASFDVVSTINSLDHVDDLDRVIAELKRVVAPGGTLLLITDVNHDPTPCEPQVFGWDVVERFAPEFSLVEERHFEKAEAGTMETLTKPVPYEHGRRERRYGVLSVAFRRV